MENMNRTDMELVPRRGPSPTFAKFNPGLVYSAVPSQPVTIIKNYYFGYQKKAKESKCPNQLPPQCSDVSMSRCQKKRYYKKNCSFNASEIYDMWEPLDNLNCGELLKECEKNRGYKIVGRTFIVNSLKTSSLQKYNALFL